MKLIDEVNVLAEGLCQDYALEHRFRFEPMFKYTRRTDLVHWLENSTVRLSSLQSYADDSTVGGVGDPMEVLIGGLSAELKDPANPGYETVRHNLEKLLGMRVQSGGTLKVTTMTMRKPNILSFCCSDRVTREAFERWNRVQGYDAVIRIHNIFHFVHAILSADAKGEQRLKRFAALDPVQYADFPLDFSRQRFPRLTFIKERSQFEWQSEVRVLFGDRIPKDSTSQYYSLQIPNLDKLIDIVEVPAHWSGSLHQ